MHLTKRKTAILAVSCVAAAGGGATLVAGAGAQAPQQPNVAVLAAATALQKDAPQLASTAPARQVDPFRREGATVRGITARTGTSSVDLVTDGASVCAAPTVGGQSGSSSCSPLPLSPDAIPFQIGDDATGAWVAAVAPDGVSSVSATGDNGKTATSAAERNVAVVAVSGAREIRSVSWTTSDGKQYQQTIGEPARAVK